MRDEQEIDHAILANPLEWPLDAYGLKYGPASRGPRMIRLKRGAQLGTIFSDDPFHVYMSRPDGSKLYASADEILEDGWILD